MISKLIEFFREALQESVTTRDLWCRLIGGDEYVFTPPDSVEHPWYSLGELPTDFWYLNVLECRLFGHMIPYTSLDLKEGRYCNAWCARCFYFHEFIDTETLVDEDSDTSLTDVDLNEEEEVPKWN